MSILTDFLKLFKWDTSNADDLANQFDINKSLNENWDKIDEKAKEMDEKINNALQTISNNEGKYSNAIIKSVENIERARIYVGYGNTQNLKINSDENVTIKIIGKNILKLDEKIVPGYNITSNGITYTVNEDYSISIKGTCGSNVSSMVLLGENLNNYATKKWYEENEIVINFNVQGLSLNCRNISGSYKSLLSAKGEEIGVIYLQVNPGTEIDTIIYPYVTYKADNNFEKYKEKEITIEIPFENQEIELFEGENNIHSSAPLSFDYISDTNYEITKLNDKISEIENLLGSQATSAMLLENVASDNESGVS